MQEPELKAYQKYVDDETKRSNDMQAERISQMYPKLEELIPQEIKLFLDERYSSVDEKSKSLLGDELNIKSYAEYFSQEDEEKLNAPETSNLDKEMIFWYRCKYFKQLGIILDRSFETQEETYEYYMQQENIKKLAIPPELATEITNQKLAEYEKFQKDFVYNSKDFIENIKSFYDIPNNREAIFNRIINNIRCMTNGKDDKGFLRIIFFSVFCCDGGKLDYILLHEICHSIDSRPDDVTDYTCGFDSESQLNPYNNKKRKYEKLNEIITDIFAIEARKHLQDKGIYFLEPKQLVVEDVKDCNTSSIVKNLLTEFLDKYRSTIIRARLIGNINELFDIIGEENFEELNDVVNKVDSLSGLAYKLENNQIEDPVVIEYYKQLDRLKQIYFNMEMHQEKRFSADNLYKCPSTTQKLITKLKSMVNFSNKLDEKSSHIENPVNDEMTK